MSALEWAKVGIGAAGVIGSLILAGKGKGDTEDYRKHLVPYKRKKYKKSKPKKNYPNSGATGWAYSRSKGKKHGPYQHSYWAPPVNHYNPKYEVAIDRLKSSVPMLI